MQEGGLLRGAGGVAPKVRMPQPPGATTGILTSLRCRLSPRAGGASRGESPAIEACQDEAITVPEKAGGGDAGPCGGGALWDPTALPALLWGRCREMFCARGGGCCGASRRRLLRKDEFDAPDATPCLQFCRLEEPFGCSFMVEWLPDLEGVRLQGSNSSSTIRRFKDGDVTFLSAKDLFLAACGGRSRAESLWGADPGWESAYADAGPAIRRGPFENQAGVGWNLHAAVAGEAGGEEEDWISAHGVSAMMYFILHNGRQPEASKGSTWRKQVEDLVQKVALALDTGGVGTSKKRTALVDSDAKNEGEWDDVSEMLRRATGADKFRGGTTAEETMGKTLSHLLRHDPATHKSALEYGDGWLVRRALVSMQEKGRHLFGELLYAIKIMCSMSWANIQAITLLFQPVLEFFSVDFGQGKFYAAAREAGQLRDEAAEVLLTETTSKAGAGEKKKIPGACFSPEKWFHAEMSTVACRLVLPLADGDDGKLTLVIAVSYDARMLAFKTPRPNTAGFIFFPTSPNCNRAQNCRCFGMYDAGEDAALIAEQWEVRRLHSPCPPIRSRFHFWAPPSFSSGQIPIGFVRLWLSTPFCKPENFSSFFFLEIWGFLLAHCVFAQVPKS